MRSSVWFVVGLAAGVLTTLNGCFRRPECGAARADSGELLVALDAARANLRTAMADARRKHPVNVVASCQPCAPCRPCDCPALEVVDDSHTNGTDIRGATTPVRRFSPKVSQQQQPRYFLVGLVMHVERAMDYLDGTLTSLASSELAHSEAVAGSPSLVIVFDASARPSEKMRVAQAKFRSSGLFRFERQARDDARQQRPTAARQARDVAAALRAVLATTPDFRYVLLLEDDWLACRGLLSSVVLALEAAHHAFGDAVSAVRVSYGLNGVVVPKRRVAGLADHLDKSADRDKNPPDHAFTAWALDTGTLVTFRHNAFVHVGSQSSIGNSGARWNAACYELLYDWLHSDTEAFQIAHCAHDVISPCLPKHRTKNPHPERRKKDFTCDVALQDMPAYRASNRLVHCLRSRFVRPGAHSSPETGKTADLIATFHQ
mmetsp:Transcript_26237/g.84910  ORF Transcript_26237/g.84910 Transcript_26237/m.84910 type:complete len:432 (-) Transcript_26237:367-1662(-)